MIDKILALHDSLAAAEVDHAFGGALALAYCTEHPRGTIDIDVNLFVDPSRAREVLEQLPDGVRWTNPDVERAAREEQLRLFWDRTPVDLFFATHEFHDQAAAGRRSVEFADTTIPVLGCVELAVFKCLYDRTRDWADLEAMHAAGALDADTAAGWLARLLGPDDPRLARLTTLARHEVAVEDAPGRSLRDLRGR